MVEEMDNEWLRLRSRLKYDAESESGLKYSPPVPCCASVALRGMEVRQSVALQSDEASSASDRRE